MLARWALSTVVVVLALAGCTSPTPDEAPAPHATAPADAGSGAILAADPSAAQTWTMRDDQGHAFDLTFAVSAPQRFDAGAAVWHQGFQLGRTCTGYHPSTDAVITATITVSAATPGVPAPLNVRALFSRFGLELGPDTEYEGTGIPPFQGDDRVMVEQFYTDDEACRVLSSTDIWGFRHQSFVQVSWPQGLSEGATGTHQMFIIVRDFYGDALGEGDTALLDWIVFRPLVTDGMMPFSAVTPAGQERRLSYLGEVGMTLSGRLIPSATGETAQSSG